MAAWKHRCQPQRTEIPLLVRVILLALILGVLTLGAALFVTATITHAAYDAANYQSCFRTGC